MATTKNQIISDVELRLTKGKPSDDMSVRRNQISYWIDLVRDQIVSETIEQGIAEDRSINPYYIEKDSCLVPVKEADDCVDCEEGKRRFYITLTRDVMPLIEGRGIVRVIDSDGRTLPVTTFHQLEMFRNLMFAQPTRKNQMCYREGRNIYIEKIGEKDLQYFEYDVFYIPLAEGSGVGEDVTYPLEDDLIPVLTDKVVEMGLMQMKLGTADLENDGTDPTHYANEQ